jgi:membrane fusion protein (multidrug efflux system)
LRQTPREGLASEKRKKSQIIITKELISQEEYDLARADLIGASPKPVD